MKLSPTQVQHIQQQIEIQPIPERHSTVPQLEQAFGDHTFFLDSKGLKIVEPSPTDSRVGNIVKLATWTENSRSALAPNPPEATPVVVELGASGTDDEDSSR